MQRDTIWKCDRCEHEYTGTQPRSGLCFNCSTKTATEVRIEKEADVHQGQHPMCLECWEWLHERIDVLEHDRAERTDQCVTNLVLLFNEAVRLRKVAVEAHKKLERKLRAAKALLVVGARECAAWCSDGAWAINKCECGRMQAERAWHRSAAGME